LVDGFMVPTKAYLAKPRDPICLNCGERVQYGTKHETTETDGRCLIFYKTYIDGEWDPGSGWVDERVKGDYSKTKTVTLKWDFDGIKCWPCLDTKRALAPALDGPCPHCQ
jgi:hypothetical protein